MSAAAPHHKELAHTRIARTTPDTVDKDLAIYISCRCCRGSARMWVSVDGGNTR